jgi:hypothetical protein
MASKGGLFAVAGASSRPMAAFSGFYKSPGLPTIGQCTRYCTVAPLWLLKRPATEVHSLLSPHLSFDQNVAKRPCYGPSKDSGGSSLSSAAEAMLGVFSGGV